MLYLYRCLEKHEQTIEQPIKDPLKPTIPCDQCDNPAKHIIEGSPTFVLKWN